MPTPPFIADLRKKIGHDLLLLPTIVVIARDPHGHILLVHDRDANQWTLPGGIIEPGEAPADAAVREVWEETSVLVRLTGLVGVVGGQGCETHYGNGDKIAWVATIFTASVGACRPTSDGSETSEARFVAPHDLASMAMRADSLRCLEVERLSTGSAYFQAPIWRPA
ncbi:MAG: NUDIX domain-containing protein [Chryseolinea sp.]